MIEPRRQQEMPRHGSQPAVVTVFNTDFGEGSAMQSLRIAVIAIVAGAAVPVLCATAHAQGVPAGTAAAQCVKGCAMQKKACVQTARTVALACKQDCRQNTAPDQLGTCMKGCSSTFRATKDTCRADQQTCIAGCRAAGPGGGGAGIDSAACLGTCGSDLADCARGVTSAAKDCVSGCRGAPDRLACLQGCGAAAETGAQTCASNFEMCSTSCAPAP
jgi:hypothetical protein